MEFGLLQSKQLRNQNHNRISYLTLALLPYKTTKLSYRKDDRAMRHIGNGCRENFRESLTTPWLLSLKFLMGFLLRSIL